MAKHFSVSLPRQRLSYSQKTKKWRTQNIDFADSHSFYHSDKIRQTLQNKLVNYNLYNGYVDARDIQKILNPYSVDASFVPDNIPHHPILVPKIDLLVGEEINRSLEYTAIVTNPNAISKKEEDKKAYVQQQLVSILKSSYEGEELEKQVKELERDLRTWQDSRELMINRILRHYEQEQDFAIKFNEGFKDALIAGEEIYQCDIENNEPVLHKLNPLKVHSIRSGNSNKIEDADLIILEDHWSPGRIIDVFHEELKPADIDAILNYSGSREGSEGSYTDNENNHLFLRDQMDSTSIDSHLGIAELNGHYFSSDYTDSQGNIRVLRVYWKSQKKMLKVKYYDENGDTQYKLMSEEYILDKDKGEESTTLWINEAWEGTKVGTDIYLNMRPRQVQYSKLNNPSYNHFGIVGSIYNTNQGRAVSLVDRMKNYQYMYDILWDRLNKGIQKNYGKILELDLAMVPDNWEIDKWMHFAVVNGIAVKDSFKEGNKGASTGKLSGNMGQSKGHIDMETGSYIQQHVNLLEFIKMEMGEIAGISRQREGQVQNRETKGGVERSVNQSSHITEWWFMKHEDVKKRVLTAFVETAKIALKDGNKKIQYILDDQSSEILNVDGDELSEIDAGIAITSSSKSKQLIETMKQLAQSFLQNGGSFSTVMDIYLSPSLSDMRRRIERTELDNQEREAQAQEQQIKAQQENTKAMIQDKQADRDLKKYEIDKRSATEIQKAIIQSQDKEFDRDANNDGIADINEIQLDTEKLNITKEKNKNDHLLKMQKINQDWEVHKDKMEKEDKKIAKQGQNKTSK